ncbi:MAG: hypothetical protein JKY59_01620 [Emcibacter sp.]|nr:hypothetical protein [Emcibacter sp.]
MSDKGRPDRDRLQNYYKKVHVFGIRRGKFIEFEFTVAFEELTIELVMPYSAFKEFCETNHVAEIGCATDVKAEFHSLSGGKLPKLHKFVKTDDQDSSEQELPDHGNIIQLGDLK